MKNNIKLLAMLLALIMTLSTLAACAAPQEESDTTSETSEIIENTEQEVVGSSETTSVVENNTEEVTTKVETSASSTETPTESTEKPTEAPTEAPTELPTEPPYVDPATCPHYDLTRWTVVEGKLEEERICVDCGTVADRRTTSFSLAKIKVPQSFYQTSMIIPEGKQLITVQVSRNTKIVVPSTAEYNLEIDITELEIEGGVLNNATYFSVDGGASWQECTKDEDSVAIALRSDMFTGKNVRNRNRALNNGIVFGVIPGYMADYVGDKISSDHVLPILKIRKEDLTTSVDMDGGHHDEALIITAWCKHTNLEDRSVETNDNGDGTVTYTYKCSACDVVLGTSRKIPKTITYYWSPITTYYYDNGVDADNRLMPILTQGGEAYVNADPSKAGAKMEIFPADCVDRDVSAELGRYVAVKYRATGNGYVYLKVFFEGTSSDTAEQMITFGATNGWVVAIVDVSQAKGYEEGKTKTLGIRLGSSIDIDISYVAMSNDISDLQALLNEGETYYYRGENFASTGAECYKDGSCKTHDVKIVETKVEGGTEYRYICPVCEIKVSKTLTVPDSVKYIADLFANEYHDNNQDEPGSVYPKPQTDGENLFVRYTPSDKIGGKEMQAKLTYTGKSSSASAVLGKYVAIRYRTTRVGTNTSFIRLMVEIDDQTAGYVVNSDSYTNGEWVVVIIDISSFPGYDADKIAEGREQKIRIDMQFAMTLDVSHLVITDNLLDITAMLGEDETYIFRGNSFSNPDTVINPDGTCKVHGLVVTSTVGETSTTYSYSCMICGQTIGESRTVPHSVKVLADVSSVGSNHIYTNINDAQVQRLAENNEVFVRVTNTSSRDTACDAINGETKSPNGKYLVIKYRVNGLGEGKSFYLQLFNTSTANHCNVFVTGGSEWQTAVINLENIAEYNTEEEQAFYTRLILKECSVDVAYVVVSDSLDELVETDSYMLFTASSGEVRTYTVYNQDGTQATNS